MINLIILITCLTILFALFVLKTKAIGEWSLMAVSYGLFLLFVLYWKSGDGRLDGTAVVILFLAAFCNAAHEVMGAFCWDFIFEFANRGTKKITWRQACSGEFSEIVGTENVTLINKEFFAEIMFLRFELTMIHPVVIDWYYILDFDCDLEIDSGQVIIFYKSKPMQILNAGDFIVIPRKEIHKIVTNINTVFKFSCRK